MRYAMAATVGLLALLQPAWHGWTAPWPVTFALLLSLPLPWILAGRIRAGAAASLMSIPFLIHGIMEFIVARDQAVFALAETGLAIAVNLVLIFWTVARRRSAVAQGE